MSQATQTVASEGNTKRSNPSKAAAEKAAAAAEETKALAHATAVNTAINAVFTSAGSMWESRLEMGAAINAATKSGVTLAEITSGLWSGTFEQVRAVRAVVSIGKSKDEPDAKGTGLSKLAKVARILGADIVSPDGKHTVSSDSVARWALSSDDAYKLAGLLEPRQDKKGKDTTKVRVSTLKAIVDAAVKAKDDTHGAKVLRDTVLKANEPKSRNPGSKKLRVSSKVYADVLAAAKKAGFTGTGDKGIDGFIASLLAKK